MAFFISLVISTRDAHISPRAEGPRANMLKKSDDPYIALLSYRATPLANVSKVFMKVSFF